MGVRSGESPAVGVGRVVEPTIDVHLRPGDLEAVLRADVAAGLSATPKQLPPKWFYDERGSELFDRITRLDEYYPTEAERSILLARADEIVARTLPDTIVELGSGTSDKTAAVLDAACRQRVLGRFIPFDVSEEFLRESAERLALRYPGVTVHGVVGDFDRHLDRIPAGGRRLVMMLGSTIGNYEPVERKDLLAAIARGLEPGDHVLLGTDLVKDLGRLERAYDDSLGVTAAFNKNVLSVINQRLGADFDLDRFEHVVRFDPYDEWIEMHLRSTVAQLVRVPALELEVSFRAGELMRTEISSKFREQRVRDELGSVGLAVVEWWTDPAGDFGVSLSVCR